MSLTRGVRNSRPRWTMGRPRCCRWELGRSYPPTDGIARHWASMVDTPRYGIHPCAPLAPRCKSELVAWSLEPFARHTQTVNLYAPLTLPVGQARGKHYPQVWSGGRLVGPRTEVHTIFAVRVLVVRTQHELSASCIEPSGMRTGSVAARSARPPRSYRVRHRRLELWTSSQERRGLCQAPDTRMWLNARKVEDETSFVCFRRQAHRWKGRVSSVLTPSRAFRLQPRGPQDPVD